MIIREIKESDLRNGFLEVLDNLVSPDLDEEQALKIFRKIKLNKLHRIFVAIKAPGSQVIGCITLLIELKFISKGIKVGYIEDVAVLRGHEGRGIGRKLVNYATNYASVHAKCKKIILYCSKKNVPFYAKMGFKIDEGAVVMNLDFNKIKQIDAPD
jgi:glucosamine-phosphate N-acetyltransferase